ncbi:MAG: ankyrin repeat domain-containing protein [Pseudomonadota bacterium]
MNEPRDELLERYADAVAQDPRRPSERVRNAARAHAQMLRDQVAEVARASGGKPATRAANQPQWTLSLVASLAVVGLAGLLYLQIDRGAPEDREVALGVPARGGVAPAAAPASAQPPAPSAQTELAQAADVRQRADKKTVEHTATAAPPTAAAPAAAAPAKTAIADATDKKASSNRAVTLVQDAPQAIANVEATKPYVAAKPTEADAARRPDTNRSAETSASAGTMPDTQREASAEAPPRAAPIAKSAAAPAALAPPPPPAPAAVAATPGGGATSTMAARARSTQTNPAATQFLEAARTGQTEAIERLLTQGVSVNTRDDGGNTALMLAVTHQQAQTVRKLLAMGADPALVNREGLSALQLANRLELVDMVKLLQTPR